MLKKSNVSYCYLIGTCHDGSRSISGSTAWDSYDYTENMLGYADSIADTVTKFILRFVERVCLEANINTDHVKSLQSLVPLWLRVWLVSEYLSQIKPIQARKLLRVTDSRLCWLETTNVKSRGYQKYKAEKSRMRFPFSK